MDHYSILTLLLIFGYVAHAAVPSTGILADQNNVQFPNYQTARGAVKAGMASYWFASGGFDHNNDIYNYNNNVMLGSVADNYLSVTTWDSTNKFTSVNGKTSFNTGSPVSATGVFPNGDVFVGFGHAGNFAGFTQNFITSSLYTQGQSYTLTSENVVNSAVNYALKLFAIADTNGVIKVYNMNTFAIVVEISSADYSLGANKIELTATGIYADTHNPIDDTRGVYFKQYTSTGFSSSFQHKVYSKNKQNSGKFSTTSDGTVLAVVSENTNELVFYQYQQASNEFSQVIYTSSNTERITEYFTMTDDGTVFIAQSVTNGKRSNGYKRATPGPTTGSSNPTNSPYTTAQATNPPSTNPPATNPPATNPPATNPPATNPPATNPPATNPPATNPPATNPPATNPPTSSGQPTSGSTVRPTSAPTSSSTTARPTSPGTSSTGGGSGTTNPTGPSTTGSSSGGGGGYIGGPSQLKVLKFDPITNTWIDSEILNLRGSVYYINSAGSGDVIVSFTSSFTSTIWIRNVVAKVPAPTPTLYFSATSAEATIGYGLPDIDVPYDHLEVELINTKDGSVVFSSKTIPIPAVGSSRLYRLNARNNSTNSTTSGSTSPTNSPSGSPSSPTATPSPGGGGEGGGIVPNEGERYAYTTIKCPPMNAMFTGKVSVVMKDGERSAVPGTVAGKTPDPESLAYVMISYTSCYSYTFCYGYSCSTNRGCGSENAARQLKPTGDDGTDYFLSLDGKQVCIEDYRGSQQCKDAVVGAYLSAQTSQTSSIESSYQETESFSITSIVTEKVIRTSACPAGTNSGSGNGNGANSNGNGGDTSLSSTVAVNVGLLLVALISVALL